MRRCRRAPPPRGTLHRQQFYNAIYQFLRSAWSVPSQISPDLVSLKNLSADYCLYCLSPSPSLSCTSKYTWGRRRRDWIVSPRDTRISETVAEVDNEFAISCSPLFMNLLSYFGLKSQELSSKSYARTQTLTDAAFVVVGHLCGIRWGFCEILSRPTTESDEIFFNYAESVREWIVILLYKPFFAIFGQVRWHGRWQSRTELLIFLRQVNAAIILIPLSS